MDEATKKDRNKLRTDSDDERTERDTDTERTTETTGQSDNPNLIDDVV